MMAVISGELTVSEGARRLGLSRNHFQTLLHRGLGALIDGDFSQDRGTATDAGAGETAGGGGGPTPSENERLQSAGGDGGTDPGRGERDAPGPDGPGSRRERGERKRPRRTSERCRERLAALCALVARGLTLQWSARGIGVHVSTASRWRCREARGQPLVRRRGPPPRILSPRPAPKPRNSSVTCAASSGRRRCVTACPASHVGRPQPSRPTPAAQSSVSAARMRNASRRRTGHPARLRCHGARPRGRRSYALVAADGCVPFRTSWASLALRRACRRRNPPPRLRDLRRSARSAHGSGDGARRPRGT